MSDENVYGPSIDPSDVERAMQAHLELWLPSYIARQRRKRDPEGARWPNGVAPISSFVTKTLVGEKWPEDQMPCFILRSPGMVQDPVIHGDGSMDGIFGITLAPVAEGGGEDPEGDARELARLYGRAANEAVMQHPDLGGFATQSMIGQEENFPVNRGTEDSSRTLASLTTPVTILIEGIMNVQGGLREPPEDPEIEPDDLPTVQTTSVEIERGEAKVAELREQGYFDES